MIVDAFNAALRALVAAFVSLSDAFNPLAGLAVASALIGVGMLWVVGKTSDQRAIVRARKRMQARLLEMRLYRDEPGLVFRAQGHLLLENCRYLGHMLRPALFLAVPMVMLYSHFDSVYGRRPLQPDESALVFVETAMEGARLELSGTESVLITSMPVSARATRQVVWRIHATADGQAPLLLKTPHEEIEKSAIVADGLVYVSAVRARSWWQRLLLAPGESGYHSEHVRSLSIGYPSREIGLAGWETHWVVWFLIISLLTAYLLRGVLGVAL